MGSDVGMGACFAAHSALYFRPDGLVQACCATGFAVGSVLGEERQTLKEIWDGAALAAQRAALEQGSYEFGCQECEVAESTGGRQAALASHFDRFAADSAHEYPKLLDLALSSRCNLQCVMCNGSLSSSIRTQREGLPPLPDAYDDRFFDELEEFLAHVERLQFKGGEPFLARENRRIWDRLIDRGLTPEMTVTTNGTVLNDDVERYVRELRMHPIVSVDGVDASTLEAIRVGVDATRLWHNIDRFQQLAELTGRGMTLSFCLMRSNWREALPFLVEVDRRGLNCNIIFVNQPHQFDLLRLPRDELQEVHRAMAGLTPTFETPEPERAWNEVLTRIDSQLENPVEIVVHAKELLTPPVDAGRQDALRAALTERHGHAPLVLDTLDGIVSHVDAPEWSGWLAPAEWLGRPMHSIGAHLTESIGEVATRRLTSDEPDVEVMMITVSAPGGPRALRLHRVVDAATGNRRAFIVEQAPRALAEA